MIDWDAVACHLRDFAGAADLGWRLGQDDGLRWLADRLQEGKPGVLIADEVGLGKTRIATMSGDRSACPSCSKRSFSRRPAAGGSV